MRHSLVVYNHDFLILWLSNACFLLVGPDVVNETQIIICMVPYLVVGNQLDR